MGEGAKRVMMLMGQGLAQAGPGEQSIGAARRSPNRRQRELIHDRHITAAFLARLRQNPQQHGVGPMLGGGMAPVSPRRLLIDLPDCPAGAIVRNELSPARQDSHGR